MMIVISNLTSTDNFDMTMIGFYTELNTLHISEVVDADAMKDQFTRLLWQVT